VLIHTYLRGKYNFDTNDHVVRYKSWASLLYMLSSTLVTETTQMSQTIGIAVWFFKLTRVVLIPLSPYPNTVSYS